MSFQAFFLSQQNMRIWSDSDHIQLLHCIKIKKNEICEIYKEVWTKQYIHLFRIKSDLQ